jgi:hypothetical protein
MMGATSPKQGAMSDPWHDIFDTTFFGVRAIQHWSDVVLWETFFNEHPDIKTVVELGSGGHGLSIIFALHGITRGFQLHMFDRKRYKSLDWPLPSLLGLEETSHAIDLFSEQGEKKVADLLQTSLHPLLLFCDNGDKPREFAAFVPHLQAGDYVGVHDWGLEFFMKDTLEGSISLEPWRFDMADQMGGSTRIWEVQP